MGMGCEPILVQDVCHKAKSMYKHSYIDIDRYRYGYI